MLGIIMDLTQFLALWRPRLDTRREGRYEGKHEPDRLCALLVNDAHIIFPSFITPVNYLT